MFGDNFKFKYPRLFILLLTLHDFLTPVCLQTFILIRDLLFHQPLFKVFWIFPPCFIITVAVTFYFRVSIFHDMLAIAESDPSIDDSLRNYSDIKKKDYVSWAAITAYFMYCEKYKDNNSNYVNDSRNILYLVLLPQIVLM